MKILKNSIFICLFFLGAFKSWSAYATDDFNEPMKFTIAYTGGNCNGCVWISAMGVIDQSTPQQFQKFLEKQADGKPIALGGRIVLNSPGGNLVAGLELGRLFRKYQFTTSIGKTEGGEHNTSSVSDGICASACAYAFLGGVSRSMSDEIDMTKGSKIGFHQFYNSTVVEANIKPVTIQNYTLSSEQFLSGLIAAYLVEMGIDARVLTLASLVGKDDLLTPDDAVLKSLKIVTSEDFNPWQIEPFKNGIRAFTIRDSIRSPERKMSAYCIGNDKQAFVEIETDKTQADKPSISSELSEVVSGVIISNKEIKDSQMLAIGSGNNLQQYSASEIKVDKKDILTKINKDTYSISIKIDEKIKSRILMDKLPTIDIDSSRYFFGTFIGVRLDLSNKEKQMLKLAWSNCV